MIFFRMFLGSFSRSIFSMIVFTIALGIVYPFAVWVVGQLFFHKEAEGRLYKTQNGEILGSAAIGQNFSGARYFHPRPSAAGKGYDAANSAGSNLGPTNQKLIDSVRQRAAGYRSENGLAAEDLIPADAVMASGSGLDPHISVENARLQASRVARARGLSLDEVDRMIDENTNGKTFGILGEKRVHVLRLNLALDGTRQK